MCYVLHRTQIVIHPMHNKTTVTSTFCNYMLIFCLLLPVRLLYFFITCTQLYSFYFVPRINNIFCLCISCTLNQTSNICKHATSNYPYILPRTQRYIFILNIYVTSSNIVLLDIYPNKYRPHIQLYYDSCCSHVLDINVFNVFTVSTRMLCLYTYILLLTACKYQAQWLIDNILL